MFTIASSSDHWYSPFFMETKCPKNKNDRWMYYKYELSKLEKITAVGLTILTAPTIIGAIFTFYLSTAYFKNRALKQLHGGLSVLGKCKTENQNLKIYRGFGEFRPYEPPKCPCCKKCNFPETISLEDCNYNYEFKLSKDQGISIPFTMKKGEVKGTKHLTIDFDNNGGPYVVFLANIKPLTS